MATETLVPAAQYLRMSTDHQRYSIPHQEATIARYAQEKGFQIIRTYKDEGKSGLILRYREGLQQLLDDVICRRFEFRAILVYDISRWGRFQNVDEAGHYEFICTQAGIPVHYCAEQFENDGSLPSTILKTLRRVMAAEYSRDLSVKIYASLHRAFQEGCHLGSGPGYGFRRMLFSGDGTPKQVLRDGEEKNVRTDRVKLVLGPSEEIRVVRLIYRMLLDDGMRPSDIVRELARRGIKFHGRPWSFYAVKHVLTHPRYCGVQAWGCTDTKLNTGPRRVPKEQWVISPERGPAIVDEQTFARAQRSYYDRTDRKSDDELLRLLRTLWRQRSYLTADLVDASQITPSVNTYKKRFGSIRRSFQLIGYHHSKTRVRRSIEVSRRRHDRLRQHLMRMLERMFAGRVVSGDYEGYLLCPQIGAEVLVSICRATKFWNSRSWYWSPRRDQTDAIALLCLLNESNSQIEAYYVFPPTPPRHEFRFSANSRFLLSGTKLPSIRDFYQAVVELHRQRSGLEHTSRDNWRYSPLTTHNTDRRFTRVWGAIELVGPPPY